MLALSKAACYTDYDNDKNNVIGMLSKMLITLMIRIIENTNNINIC